MAIGRGAGDQRAMEAAESGRRQPASGHLDGGRARRPLQHHRAVPILTLAEINEAAEIINKAADPEANIIFGTVTDPSDGQRGQDHADRDRLRSGGARLRSASRVWWRASTSAAPPATRRSAAVASEPAWQRLRGRSLAV